MTSRAGKSLGQGLAWFGFWIGLGLWNFEGKGCSPSWKDDAGRTRCFTAGDPKCKPEDKKYE